MKRGSILAVVIAVVAVIVSVPSTPSTASEPIDSLRRRSPEVGSVEFKLGATYHPRSDESVAGTPDGPAHEKRVSHDIGLDFTLKIKAARRLSIEIGRNWTERVMLVERSLLSQPEEPPSSERRRASSVPVTAYGLVFSPWPDHAFDPTLILTVSGSGRSTLRLSASFIADPTVLSAGIGITRSSDAADALEISLGVGFVANDKVSFGASVSHATAPGTVHPPSTALSVRLGYAVGAKAESEIGVATSLYVAGGAPRAGFGVYWQGEAFSW